MTFEDRKYTLDSIVKQAVLMELHGKDGSAVDADCGCVESKHTFMMEALAEEGVGFAESDQERAFFNWVAEVNRQIRKHIDVQDWSIPGVGHSCPPCECHECPPCNS